MADDILGALSKATSLKRGRSSRQEKIGALVDAAVDAILGPLGLAPPDSRAGTAGELLTAIALPGIKFAPRTIQEALETLARAPKFRQPFTPDEVMLFDDYSPMGKKVVMSVFRSVPDADILSSPSTVRAIDPRELVPGQTSVFAKQVGKYIESPPTPAHNPQALEYEGIPFLFEGHHRSTAALARGQKVPVQTFNIEDVLKNYLKRSQENQLGRNADMVAEHLHRYLKALTGR